MRNLVLVLFAGALGAALLLGAASFGEAAAFPAPTSPSPSDGGTAEQPVTLKWSKVTFPAGIAGGYLLEILGSTGPMKTEWASTNSHEISEVLILGEEHKWRVRACQGFGIPSNTESECGPWSNNGEMWTFMPTLAKPQLVSPANTTQVVAPVQADGRITLKWEAVFGADRYNVILTGAGFSHTFAFPEVPANATSFPVPKEWIQLNTTYSWQVIPLQGSNLGPVSDLWRFFVALGPPKLTKPADGEIITLLPPEPEQESEALVRFEWMQVDRADTYYLEVFLEDGRILPQDTGNNLSRNMAVPLGSHEWQVTACKSGLVSCGGKSERRDFSVVQDRDDPRIETFSAEPDAPDWVTDNVEISWRVSDRGGSNLKQVEVWRASFVPDSCDDNTKEGCAWGEQPLKTVSAPENVDSWSGSTIDSPPEDIWWYGLHAVDKANNRITETEAGKRPIKVQVDKTAPQCEIVIRGVSVSEITATFLARGVQEELKYRWVFGDGKEASGTISPPAQSIEHKYPERGTFTVELHLTDEVGNTKSCDRRFSFQEPPPAEEEASPEGEPPRLREGQTCHPSQGDRCQSGLICDINNKCVPGPGLNQVCDPTEADACVGTLVCNPETKRCESPSGPGLRFANPLRATTFAAVLDTVLDFLFTIALVVTPLALLAGAFLFVTASGNPEQVSRAKKTLIWTLVGLLVIILSKGIVNVIQGILGV